MLFGCLVRKALVHLAEFGHALVPVHEVDLTFMTLQHGAFHEKPEKLQNESQRFPFSTTARRSKQMSSRSCLRPRVESDVLGRSQIYPH